MMLAVNFENLHGVLRNLYGQMLPLCGDMIGVAKGIAGLGALLYVAYRVWQAMARAEPLDVFPLLRPFAIGICIIFFPTLVLGGINAVMSPVVTGAHGILERQIADTQVLQQQKDDLKYEERVRDGEAWLDDKQAWDEKLYDKGINDYKISGMWMQRQAFKFKLWLRQLIRDFFETMYHAAALSIDTLRTFFLVALSILGPLSFALSVYDGFQPTLTHWLSRYICVYLWLPIADIFSAVLSKVQELILKGDVAELQDPSYIPDAGSGMMIVFYVIGIVGYFSIPTIANWIVMASGSHATRGANVVASKGAAATGNAAGTVAGNIAGRLMGK